MILGFHGIPLLLYMVCVAVMDFQYRKFKNAMFLLGIFYNFLLIYLFHAYEWGEYCFGGLILFLLFIFLYFFKIMGGGDVKFGLVIGLFLGFSLSLGVVLLISFVLSMIHSLFFLFWESNRIYVCTFLNLTVNSHKCVNNVVKNKMRASIPFAGYMAVSTIFLMLYRPLP